MKKSAVLIAVTATALAIGLLVVNPWGGGQTSSTTEPGSLSASWRPGQQTCETVLSGSPLTDLGWKEEGEVTSSAWRCERESDEGFVHLSVRELPDSRDPVDELESECAALAATERDVESPSTWLGAGRLACATHPRPGSGLVLAKVLTDGGVVVTLQVGTITAPTIAEWRAVLGGLAYAAAGEM